MKLRMSLKPGTKQHISGNAFSKRQYLIEQHKRDNKVKTATKLKVDKSNKIQFFMSILVLLLIISNLANAHRGARNEVDQCRISVGSEVVHFTAYTPGKSGGKGFCKIVPELDLTHLVFDYEGSKLRHTTVEFEITKEPEGSRVYYHKPEIIKKGSVDAKVDFIKHGAGNYLAHITIVNDGEKLDSHLPFSVGLESDEGMPMTLVILLSIIAVIITAMIIVSLTKKRASDEQ